LLQHRFRQAGVAQVKVKKFEIVLYEICDVLHELFVVGTQRNWFLFDWVLLIRLFIFYFCLFVFDIIQ
jgi:hypothetical protein